VLVKILTLDQTDRNNLKVTASVKQAGENPYEQALKK
jgi:ribosomal protein S1